MEPNETSLGIREYCVKKIHRRESAHSMRYGLDNKKIYDRGCARSKPDEPDYCARFLEGKKGVQCYACETDMCNGAHENEVKAILFCLAFLIVSYIKLQSFKD